MHFSQGFIYHIYNQANNKEVIFRDNEDYHFFMQKVNKWLKAKCEILEYCIMPNHFHFMILATNSSVEKVSLGSLMTNELSNAFRLIQSQYAQDFNGKYHRTGSVFRPRIKCKELNTSKGDHTTACFQYIHENPKAAGLVKDLKSWSYSSFMEYTGQSSYALVNKKLAKEYVLIDD